MNLAKTIKLLQRKEADKPKSDIAPITVRLTPEAKESLDAIAVKMDKSVNWIVSRLIDSFLNDWNKEA